MSVNKIVIEPDIYRTLRFFHEDGEVFEVCAINPHVTQSALWSGGRVFGKDKIVAGWFDDIKAACEFIAKLDAMGCEGIYHTPNPCNDGLLSRAGNRLVANVSRTTNDDITMIRSLLIDVDPKRPSGISSTAAELECSIQATQAIKDYLSTEGWALPARSLSGNGGHLAYAVNLPNTRENIELVKGFVAALDWKFGGDVGGGIKLEVDRKVFNAARLFKVYGTWARKGENTKARPHRLSKILELPEKREEISTEQIHAVMEKLAAEAPEYVPGQYSGKKRTQLRVVGGKFREWDGGQQKPMDVEGYLEHYGRAVVRVKDHGGSTLYVLKECVFDSSHSGGEAAVGVTSEGKLFYQCFHNSCSERTWAEAREIISGDDSMAQWIPDFKPAKRGPGRPRKDSGGGGGRSSQAFDEAADDAIQIIDGQLPEITRRCLEKMRQEGICYDRNGELVRLAGGAVYPVTVDWLKLHLTEVAAFQKYDARSEGWKYCNCTTDIARTVASMSGLWALPPLNGIMTCPTITPSGRIIEEHGYDQETGVFLHFPEGKTTWEKVNQEPGADDVREAVRMLWEPFREFPFDGPEDRGGCLSAIFTAIVRPFLNTAPGILIESPVAGSGKTKLAQSIAALSGSDGSVVSKSDDEEEMRKSLLAMSRVCTPCVIMDNISGAFKSDSLCAFLTSGMIVSRVLGASEMVHGKSSAMMLFTGNNPSIEGDLNRRILRIKINPKMEKPYLRTFDFDPVEYVEEHRLQLVKAAITVLRAVHLSQWRHNEGRLASFETWSDVVRNAVIWLEIHGLSDIGMKDPVASIETSYKMDPETRNLTALLETWFELFGPIGGTVAAAIAKAKEDPDIWNILYEIAGHKNDINTRTLGNWIQAHENRVTNDSWFTRNGTFKRSVRWVTEKRVTKPEKIASGESGESGELEYGSKIRLSKINNSGENVKIDPQSGELGELYLSNSPYMGKCQNNNIDIRIGGLQTYVSNAPNSPMDGKWSKAEKSCEGCINFTPNQMDPCAKPGTCPVDPEGKCVRMPSDGKECARFERITH